MRRRDFLPMDRLVVDLAGILKLIQDLKLWSFCGADEIRNFLSILLCTPLYFYVHFHPLYRVFYIARRLEGGEVIPLLKSGNLHSSPYYRPISLTMVPCKILEHVIFQ